MATKEKEKKIEQFSESLKNSKIAFIAEYQGLTVEQISRLRRQLKENGSEMKIIKNTLAKRAVEEVGFGELADSILGPVAFFLGYDTVVHAPKIAFDFARETEIPKIRKGFYSGKLIDLNLLNELANLPPMAELRVRFVRTMSSPPKKFLNMMMAPIRQFVTTLDLLGEKLSESEAQG